MCSTYSYASIYLHVFRKNLWIVMTLHESRHCGTRAFAVLNFPSAELWYPGKPKMNKCAAHKKCMPHIQYFAYPQSISIAFSSQWNCGKKRQTCLASLITNWMRGFSIWKSSCSTRTWYILYNTTPYHHWQLEVPHFQYVWYPLLWQNHLGPLHRPMQCDALYPCIVVILCRIHICQLILDAVDHIVCEAL